MNHTNHTVKSKPFPSNEDQPLGTPNDQPKSSIQLTKN